MPVHLYGVLDASAALAPPTPGLDGSVVRVVSVGDSFAWVSDILDPTLEPTPRRLRAHDCVLSGAMDAGHSVVPALLGRLYTDDATLIADLEGRAADLDAAKALVRERVEMSLLIAASGVNSGSESDDRRDTRGPGHEHLRRIRSQLQGERKLRREADELALAVTRALQGMVLAERMVEDPAPPVVVAHAHLVARADVARYLLAVEKVAAAADRALRVAVRGPGAAYSFAAVRIG